MTYVAGGRAQASDYNYFVSGNVSHPNVGLIWGRGYGKYGLGQDTTYVAPVAVGDLIRNDEWNNMDAVLALTTQHQAVTTYTPSTYDPGFVSVIAGRPIKTFSHYAPYIQQAYNNTGLVYSVTDSVPNLTTYTGYWGHTNARTLSVTQTLSFSDADAARYYFNAGGKIKLSFTHTGGTTARDSLWNTLCIAAGTVEIGYKNTKRLGGDSLAQYTALNANNGGYWANTAGNSLEHFRQFSASNYYYNNYYNYPYNYSQSHATVRPITNTYNYYNNYYYNDTLDYIQVLIKPKGDPGVSGGLGLKLEITTNFVNGTIVTPSGSDTVTGTTTVSLVKASPGRNYLNSDVPAYGTISFIGTASLL